MFAVKDEVPSTSSQFVEQIKIIQEIALPGLSQLNDLAPDKKQGDQTQFSPKKTPEKGKQI